LRKTSRSLKARAGKGAPTNTAELATRIQIPVLLMFLFYIFHLAGLHSLGYRWFKGLGIYDGDGNMNTMGIVFKVYYSHNIFFYERVRYG
jgi:hypothetical protein